MGSWLGFNNRGYGGTFTPLRKVGVNLLDINYFSSEQPFLNWLKNAGGNDSLWQQSWGTATSLGGGGTHEQGYLQTDANGYVKSLVASPTPPAGQVFTLVQVLIKFNINNPGSTAGLPPDAPRTYGTGAPITVRVKFTGQGTLQFGTNFTAGTIAQVSGGSFSTTANSFTSTNNGVNIFTFQVTTPTTGISMGITGIPDNVNYPRDMSVIDNQYAASFDAGAIFDPVFLQMIANVNPLRFMTWLSTDNQVWQLRFPSAITAGDASAKIGSSGGKGTFTNGSTSITGVTGWTTQSPAGDAQEIVAPGLVTPGTTGTFSSGVVTLSAPAIGNGTNVQFGYTISWSGKTGLYRMLIGSYNGGTVHTTASQILDVTLTFGSKNCVFSTTISNSYPMTPNENPGTMGSVPIYADWAHRPVLGDCFWTSSNASGASSAGIPHEAIISLCNQLNVDPHVCLPIWMNSLAGRQADWTSMATLYFNTLNSNLKFRGEFSNEVWNFGAYYQAPYSTIAGLPLFSPAQNTFSAGQEWYGTQVAQMADAWFAVYGGQYASRVVWGMGEQFALGNGDSFLRTAMNAPEWVGMGNVAPYLHPVGGGGLGAIYVAPYIGLNTISNADANTVLAQADPPTVFFGLARTNNPAGLSGGPLASVNAAGFIGKTLATITSLIAANAGQPWGALPYIAYESGTDFNTAGQLTTGNTAWQNLIYQCHRDARFEYLLYDPLHILSANDGYLPEAKAAGMSFLIYFASCSAMSSFGEYGLYENVNQPTSLATMPPKAKAIQKYALGL